ncbi:Probable ribonuclease P/MRP protein subunit POP5 [Linum grandiflorum]
MTVKYVNHITKICVIRVSRESYQNVWSAITMVQSIGNCPALLNLLDLSGNIRACKVAALKCDENKFEHYKLMPGELLSADASQPMQNCLEKLKLLDY